MKARRKLSGGLIVGCVFACSLTQNIHAVEGLTINPVGTNIVLAWTSSHLKSYAVEYKTTVDASTSWEALTNCIQADSSGTTRFTHFGVIPPPSSGGGSGGNGTNEPPPLGMAMSQVSAEDVSELPFEPPMPPLPWDSNTWGPSLNTMQTMGVLSLDDATSEVTTSASGPTCGFYRVLQVPDFSVDVTLYAFDGPTFIPVDFGDFADSLVNTEVLINGVPSDYAQYFVYNNQNGSTTPGVAIYFNRFTNGVYQIQLQTTFNPGGDINDVVIPITCSNNPASIYINNFVSCPTWEDLAIGTNYTMNITAEVQNADWEIDIYDWNGNFVDYGTGTTTNGTIQWTWNLTDINGNPRNNLANDRQFFPYLWLSASDGTMMAKSSSSSQTASNNAIGSLNSPGGVRSLLAEAPQSVADGGPQTLPPFSLDYPELGDWAIAYQDRISSPGAKQQMVSTMQDIAGTILLKYGGTPYFAELEYGPNAVDYVSQVPASDPWTAQTNRNNSWDLLRIALHDSDIRNIYYNGHGSPTLIGGDLNTYTNVYTTNADGTVSIEQEISGSTIDKTNGISTAYLTSAYVKSLVYKPNVPGIPAHPYRFAFLDGCSTAKTWDWSVAFGIGKVQTNNIGYYTNAIRRPYTRPGAYVGWAVDVGGGKEWGTTQTYSFFRSQWMLEWGYQGRPLLESLRYANDDSGWISDSLLNSSLRVCGFTDLHFNEYNTKASWP